MSPGTALRRLLTVLVISLVSASAALAQAVVDSELKGVFSGLSADGLANVIVTFHGEAGPAAADLDALKAVGITGGIVFEHLPMVATQATLSEVNALAQSPRVRSVFWDKQMEHFNFDARHITGVERLRDNGAITRTNGGLPVSGKGVGVLVIDNGLDATHPDLQLGKDVKQNVLAVADRNLTRTAGFEGLVVLEDQESTSYAGDHGTHVAGTVGGSGQASSGKHAGMATGADLLGYGVGAPLFVLHTLGGFDWAIANQARYNIRVVTNSWGSSGGFNPDHPTNVATRIAHKRNMVVLFAAGNSGSGNDTMNPYSKAPWVIAVAAGDKSAKLAGFSSRGVPGGPQTVTSNSGEVITWLNEPAITAPGVNIVSAKAIAGAPGTENVFYNSKSGTSMATPATAGIVALVLEANPLLAPDEVKKLLQETASRMPGYKPHEVGAGYVNAFAAVQKAFELKTPFGTPLTVQGLVAGVRENRIFDETYDYSPLSAPGTYKHAFEVAAGASVLEVKIEFNGVEAPLYGNLGNPLLLDVRDPNGNRYTGFDLFFAIFGTKRLSVIVGNPTPGTWTAEVKALTPFGNEAGNFATFPDRVHETINLTFVDPPAINDIQGHAAQGAIEFSLVNGFLGLCSKNSFCPNKEIRRADFAKSFTQFGAIRQFLPLGGGSTFGDVSDADKPFVEAAAAHGSALRDPQFRFAGVIEGKGGSFDPNGKIIRAEIAKMLVRGVGGEQAALNHTGDVTFRHDDKLYVIADQDQIPAALRGYVHVAINSNMLNVFAAVEQGEFDLEPTLKFYFKPGDTMTRAGTAVAISRYFGQFFK